MGDFIKELTIIDFLGMMVPGSLLLLLLNDDLGIHNIWSGYFGQNAAADTIILLVAGYLVGMVLHEIGDILEKAIWATNVLNPRYYAARKVFGNKEFSYRLLKNSNFTDEEGSDDASSKWFNTEWVEWGKVEWGKAIGSCFALTLFIFVIAFLPLNLRFGSCNGILLFLLFFGGLLFGSYFFQKSLEQNNKDKGKGSKSSEDTGRINSILDQNAAIQTLIYGKGTAPKRQIFDGFYCVMRNLLLVLGIVNSYARAFQTSALSSMINSLYETPEHLILYYLVILFMAVRCVHYAYLKYKYGYEDFLHLRQEPSEAPSKEKEEIKSGKSIHIYIQ